MSQNLTEADYDIDLPALMEVLGIEPGHVVADTARLEFVSGKAVLRYEVVRAIPAKALGLAMATAAGMMQRHAEQAEQPPGGYVDEYPKEPEPEPVDDREPREEFIPPAKALRPTKAGRRVAAKKAQAKK